MPAPDLLAETQKIVQSIQIPGPPRILLKLQQETSAPEPDFKRICSLVETDLTITARLLKIANSSYFATRTKIESLSSALSVLGLQNFKELILCVLFKEAFRSRLPLRELEIFHSHSLQTARTAKHIAQYLAETHHLDIEPELAYLAGLFHDCGMPVLSRRFDNYFQKIRNKKNVFVSMTHVEEKCFMTNHSLIGGFVAKAWDLPALVCEAIREHHQTDFGHIEHKKVKQLTALIITAEKMASECYESNEPLLAIYLQNNRAGTDYREIYDNLGITEKEMTGIQEYVQHLS